MGALVLYAALAVVAALDFVLLTGGIIAVLAYLAMLVPFVALSVKRCHDRNRSGWFMLVAAIPFVSFWYVVEVGFLPGTSGPNQYGSDPLAETRGMATAAA
jgi:uncharacterized membrane protein YhaH (DUF805 family)